MPNPTDNRLKCSFCGKSQEQVAKLIAGPGVHICNECVGLCIEILDEELFEGGRRSEFTVPLVEAKRQLLQQVAQRSARMIVKLSCSTSGLQASIEGEVLGSTVQEEIMYATAIKELFSEGVLALCAEDEDAWFYQLTWSGITGSEQTDDSGQQSMKKLIEQRQQQL